MIYYTADTHFGHENIMKHSHRPFESVDKMDEILIKNWNDKVTNKDIIYILGDFCFRSGKDPEYYLKQLNGRKVLLTGNHDGCIMKDIRNLSKYFEEITNYKEINDNGTKIVLSHYPIAEWNGFFRGALHFYGHIHNNVENKTYEIMKDIENAYNVGVDILNFAPQSKEDVIKLNKEFNLNVAKKNVFKQER